MQNLQFNYVNIPYILLNNWLLGKFSLFPVLIIKYITPVKTFTSRLSLEVIVFMIEYI
jgi:hypothetical protein